MPRRSSACSDHTDRTTQTRPPKKERRPKAPADGCWREPAASSAKCSIGHRTTVPDRNSSRIVPYHDQDERIAARCQT
jgi:hypothetical protein